MSLWRNQLGLSTDLHVKWKVGLQAYTHFCSAAKILQSNQIAAFKWNVEMLQSDCTAKVCSRTNNVVARDLAVTVGLRETYFLLLSLELHLPCPRDAGLINAHAWTIPCHMIWAAASLIRVIFESRCRPVIWYRGYHINGGTKSPWHRLSSHRQQN